ncbi:MAG: ABC transporter ATP-binding protein [Promethearchaeota archaeon]|jgi:putative ABC transport system ATP-binding protein
MANQEEIIRLDGVSKHYRSGLNKIKALDNIAIGIRKSEFLIVMGPSGSGKTTLLNVIAGLANTTSGNVLIEGNIINSFSDNQKADLRRSTFGFIFQFFNLHEGLTVIENIELPMMIANRGKQSERRKKSLELIELIDLSNRINNYPSELSGGEKQRVGIARALVNDPVIILADEPTGDLDSNLAYEIMSLLKSLVGKYHKTLVVVSHDPSLLQKDMRLLKMEDGKILEDINVTQEIIENYKIETNNFITKSTKKAIET